jgi:hypothetical protein
MNKAEKFILKKELLAIRAVLNDFDISNVWISESDIANAKKLIDNLLGVIKEL